MSGRHHHHNQGTRNIRIAFFLNAGFALLEIAGGIWTNSMAILSDAFHDLGDSAALGLAWYFQGISARERDSRYSFGYGRFSVMGAVINSFILLIGSILIISQSVPRLMDPEPVKSGGMLWLALAGIVVNGIAMIRLKKGDTQNEKVISLHLMEDVLGWVAVAAAAIVMKFRDIPVLDPILSLVITLFILFRLFGNIRKTFRILMQAVPGPEKVEEIRNQVLSVTSVTDVHDIHAWTMDGSYHVASLHVSIPPGNSLDHADQIRKAVREKLSAAGIEHATIELETDGTECGLKEC